MSAENETRIYAATGGSVRIGELARAVGVNPKTVRYYEGIGLLPAADRTSAGYRVYNDSDVERVRFIKAAQWLGLRLDEIAEVLALRDADQRPCGYVRGVLHEHVADIDERIAELQAMRWNLLRLEEKADRLASEPGAASASCPLIDHVRASESGVELTFHSDGSPSVPGVEVMTMAQRQIEVFTTGCPGCADAVALVEDMAGPGCEVHVRDLRSDSSAVAKAADYGVTRVPAVVVDGRLADCCRTTQGPTREGLAAAGVGRCS
ncbi:MerR family DNA-binding protein [Saccharopolyspora endophytica]|uniref:MerR family DNA-binding protein n=1 Tax=Saccharopolyspora endophytica TaxID=543886 RepID=A0ABS5DQS0_9PSEU|nr:MerR family DNA-binding protein [Saccharopolyspora endophytica]MBQ0928662.1 MerR family DNA-binding protein [Saccharopolyspora endophytica]